MSRISLNLTNIEQQLLRNLLQPVKATKAYTYFIVLTTVFVLPILLAGTSYIDDTARQVSGYYGWSSLGRYMTEMLMHLMNFSVSTMADMGIQMQVLLIPVLAFAGFVLARALGTDGKLRPITMLVGSLVVVNPFLLTNISFRFDSFSMVLAYALSIYAATYAMGRAHLSWQARATVITLIFIVAGLYQPEILLYAIVITLLWLNEYLSDSRTVSLKRYVNAVVLFLGGVVLYYASLKIFNFADIGTSSRGVLVPLNLHGFNIVAHNIYHGLGVCYSFMKNIEIRTIMLLSSVVAAAAFLRIVVKQWRQRGPLDNGFALFTPFIFLLLVMGPFALLISALTYQVRVLSTAIGFLVVPAVVMYSLTRRTTRAVWVLVLPALMVAYALNFSFTYGSALGSQREYDRLIYAKITYALSQHQEVANAKTVYIGGVASSPTSVQNQMVKRPLLTKMDINGDNTVWFVWNSLRNNHELEGINWYTGTADEEALRQVTCDTPNGGFVAGYNYFELRRLGDSEYVIWLIDPQARVSTFCAP